MHVSINGVKHSCTSGAVMESVHYEKQNKQHLIGIIYINNLQQGHNNRPDIIKLLYWEAADWQQKGVLLWLFFGCVFNFN